MAGELAAADGAARGQRDSGYARAVLLAVTLLIATGADHTAAQEVGAHGWWVARDANDTRGLLGGGAYVAVAPLSFVDIRVGYAAARRSRNVGEQVFCDSYRPVHTNCAAEPVETESRLSNLEIGIVGWRSLGREVRVGAGVSGIRHSLSVRDLATLSSREHAPRIARPSAYAPGMSLHAQVTPRFSPNALVFAAVARSAADFGRCSADRPTICGRGGSASIRVGVAYRFSGPLRGSY